MRTHNIPSCYRKSKRSSLFLLTWCFYQPSLARTTPVSNSNFHGPKGVRAIEGLLYMYLFFGPFFFLSKQHTGSCKKILLVFK